MKKKIYGKEKVIKFLDLLIEDIENVEYFNIKDFINKFRDIDDHDKAYLPHSIGELGKTYGLFEDTLNTEGWFKLTPKGIELKESGNGFNRFNRKLKRRLSYFEKWSIFLFLIGFLFGVYQNHMNNSLENRVQFLENQLSSKDAPSDSLKVGHYSTSGEIDSFQTIYIEQSK